MASSVKRWFSGTLFGVQGISRFDGLLALPLSAAGVFLVSTPDMQTGHPSGGLLAGILVLTFTLPVLWRRRAPLAAITMIAVGAPINGLLAGHLVRCGVALPALALVVFSVAVRCELREARIGAALAVVSVVGLSYYDPNITFAFAPPGSVLILALWCVGRLVRSRDTALEQLREHTRELAEQRDRTARLAVVAERERVAEGVDGLLRERVLALAQIAANVPAGVDEDPEFARATLAHIEHEGRRTLAEMREIVGSLHEHQPTEPQPGLSDLDGLLERATTARVQLVVDGTRRRLPSGLELSGYRIVEHLLQTLQDAPQDYIDVRLNFESDALEIRVSGAQRVSADVQTAFASAREWVALHGGALETQAKTDRSLTVVRLPLVAVYA